MGRSHHSEAPARRSIAGRWRALKLRLLLLYLLISLLLLALSLLGQWRLYSEIGQTFGGFLWGLDASGQTVIVSALPGSSGFSGAPSSLWQSETIEQVNGQPAVALPAIFRHAHPGDLIHYTLTSNGVQRVVTAPAATFTLELWWQYYGLAFVAGLIWLLVGGLLLASARTWVGAVEGLTLLPVAMLFLLYSHWGNVQTASPADAVMQLLWLPSFALLGAGFIHLSLTYRPQSVAAGRTPSVWVDALPYLPLIALEAFTVGLYFLRGGVPTRLEVLLNFGYGALGGLISLIIGLTSLAHLLFHRSSASFAIRRQLGDLLLLWLSGLGLGFGIGVLPLLLTGKTFLSLPLFFFLAAIYPIMLFYAVRSLRLIGQLQESVARTEEAMQTPATYSRGSPASKCRAPTGDIAPAACRCTPALSSLRTYSRPAETAGSAHSLAFGSLAA